VRSKLSESKPEHLEVLHDGKHYDPSNPKYKQNATTSWFKNPEPKKCDVCGKTYNGAYKDHKKWHKRWEVTQDNNPENQPKNNRSILDQLKKVDPQLIEIMDGEKLKKLIINEIKGGKIKNG